MKLGPMGERGSPVSRMSLPVIPKLQLHTPIFPAKNRHCRLEIILGGARDSKLVPLNLNQHPFKAVVLDGHHHLLGCLLVDTLLENDTLTGPTERADLDLALIEVFHRHISSGELLADDL